MLPGILTTPAAAVADPIARREHPAAQSHVGNLCGLVAAEGNAPAGKLFGGGDVERLAPADRAGEVGRHQRAERRIGEARELRRIGDTAAP